MSRFEDLSGEILMFIFEYMNVEDVWTIFFKMNRRLNTLVFDSRLHLTVNTSKHSKSKFDEFCLSIVERTCNNIYSLTLANNYFHYSQINQILSYKIFIYFQSLHSLTLIDINYEEFIKTIEQIKDLPNLNYLQINTHEIFQDKQLIDVTQALFNQPKLRTLNINLHERIQWHVNKTISLSNMEVISLNFINIDRIFYLLPYCPQLRSLSMILDSRSSLSISNHHSESLSKSIVTFPHITNLRFNLRSFNLLVLQRLFSVLPSIKCLSVDTIIYNEEYIRASFWTLLLQEHLPLLERIRLVVRGFFTLQPNKSIILYRRSLINGYTCDRYWLDRVHKKIFACHENSTSMVLHIR